MRILELAAEGWRNLEPMKLVPAERLSVLFGDNGQGKTNVLEAAYYLAALRSFRTTHADDLIQRGAPHGRAHLRAEVLHRGLERRFDVELGAAGRGGRAPGELGGARRAGGGGAREAWGAARRPRGAPSASSCSCGRPCCSRGRRRPPAGGFW